MAQQRATTTTILFSDLVGSTELMQRAGDEDAQHIFKSHYQVLRDSASANGGAEVKWLGDGLMVAFASAADAVRCAVTMQQTSRRQVAGGERLAIRVGLNAGDALRDESDYFGTSVVVARRLCDRAGPGQILCSAVVEALLAGRQAFSFRDAGELELKGIAAPVAAREVLYETERRGAFLTRTPFVGREAEMARLRARLDETRAGRGGLVMLVGEPGIGKSRTIEEFCEHARVGGATVLAGRCFEGEWAPPYGPFAEAIAAHVRDSEPDALRADLGYGAPPIARLVPPLRETLPDIEEPVPLQPDEERFRLLDAVSQFFIARSRRTPVVLVLDDLHWADRGSIAMLRHVARFAPQHRLLVLGAYRDVELDRQHPLSDALAQLRREVEYERLLLKGLDRDGVGSLVSSMAEHDVPEAFVQAISDETDGNPFFIREVLIHLTEEGKVFQQDGRWTSNVSVAEMGIPEGVRQVIGRRLSRLSADANKLLTTASGFSGAFHIDIAAAAAGMGEGEALDAIDEALQAQLVRTAGDAATCDFTHALIRHTLYAELSPPRQVRLHRQIAEAMERAYGARASDHAGELAYQYHRSAGLPGTERGVQYALAAADQAEAGAAWDEAVALLAMALELSAADDSTRPSLVGRYATALVWALRFDEAVQAAEEAADLTAAASGASAAGALLADIADALHAAGYVPGAWRLAARGVTLKGSLRDEAWGRLRWLDLARLDAEDASFVGIPIRTPERLEVTAVFARRAEGARPTWPMEALKSRDDWRSLVDELGTWCAAHPEDLGALGDRAMISVLYLGDARLGQDLFSAGVDDCERLGRVAQAALSCAMAARSYTATGGFPQADSWRRRGVALAGRVGVVSNADLQLLAARAEQAGATGEGIERLVRTVGDFAVDAPAQNKWAQAAIRAAVAAMLGWLGQSEPAVALIGELVSPLELAGGTASNYCLMACSAANALWLLDRRDHIEIVERNLRAKVVEPDFRYINNDGRLSLARLCALQERHDEASHWFAESRRVLEEDGARPLRAIVDYDEALMYARRNATGDRKRALPLLDAAMQQFSQIGMTGWTRRGEELKAKLAI